MATALGLALFGWVFALEPAAGAPAELRSAQEYAVKAAFIFNFAKFIEWPSQALAEPDAPLLLCILGADPFGDTLSAIENRTVKGRRLAIKRIRALETAGGCGMLFIARSERHRLEQMLPALQGQPVLTIADMEGFAEAGGVINLVMAEDKVRFEINLEAAQRARLQISAKLLRLGRVVTGGTEED
jgi:hypothetical protein